MTAYRRVWAEWWIDAEHTVTATTTGAAELHPEGVKFRGGLVIPLDRLIGYMDLDWIEEADEAIHPERTL